MQVDLGEENDFYYNESLGRWVERGKEDEVWTISRDMDYISRCVSLPLSLCFSRSLFLFI